MLRGQQNTNKNRKLPLYLCGMKTLVSEFVNKEGCCTEVLLIHYILLSSSLSAAGLPKATSNGPIVT
jgi:hypothetical protein